jgi:hypothetical protein
LNWVRDDILKKLSLILIPTSILSFLLTGCSGSENKPSAKIYTQGTKDEYKTNEERWNEMSESEKFQIPGYKEAMSGYEGITMITNDVTTGLELNKLAELFDKTLLRSQVAIDLAIVGQPIDRGAPGDYEISNEDLLKILREDYDKFYNIELVDEDGQPHAWRDRVTEIKDFLAEKRDGYGQILEANVTDFDRWYHISLLEKIYLQILEAYESAIAYLETDPSIKDRTEIYFNDDNPLLKTRDIFQRYHYYLFGGKIISDEFKKYDFKKEYEESLKNAG